MTERGVNLSLATSLVLGALLALGTARAASVPDQVRRSDHRPTVRVAADVAVRAPGTTASSSAATHTSKRRMAASRRRIALAAPASLPSFGYRQVIDSSCGTNRCVPIVLFLGVTY